MAKVICPYDMDDVANDADSIYNLLTLLDWWFEKAPNEYMLPVESANKRSVFAYCAPVYHSVLTAAMAAVRNMKAGVEATLEQEVSAHE